MNRLCQPHSQLNSSPKALEQLSKRQQLYPHYTSSSRPEKGAQSPSLLTSRHRASWTAACSGAGRSAKRSTSTSRKHVATCRGTSTSSRGISLCYVSLILSLPPPSPLHLSLSLSVSLSPSHTNTYTGERAHLVSVWVKYNLTSLGEGWKCKQLVCSSPCRQLLA